MINNEINIHHRLDLADVIIAKSKLIKQDENLNLKYFFAVKPIFKFSAFLMLLFAFIAGFHSTSIKSYQPDVFSENSVIGDVDYTSFL